MWLAAIAANFAALALPSPAAAEPVQLKHGALRINGNLEVPDGRTLADGVAIVLHGTMSHHGQETIAVLQKNLKARGVATLAVTLSLGIDDRKGPRACEVPHAYTDTDLGPELDRWIQWVAERGARAIDYVGFSRGGSQIVDLLQKQKGGRRAVLLAPLLQTPAEIAAAYTKAFGSDLSPALAAARAAPRETRRVDFLLCKQAQVMGAAFLDAYREIPAKAAAGIVQPVLVMIAGNDEIVPDLETRLPANVRHVVVEGSDHFFRDLNGEDAADAIAEFLRE